MEVKDNYIKITDETILAFYRENNNLDFVAMNHIFIDIMSDLSNHRKRWTVKEVKQLMKEIRTMDIQNIAKIHKRTYSGIYFKLVREAVNIA